VQQPFARHRIDDGGALVADERLLDARRLGVGQCRAEHAPGRDHDMDPGGTGGADRSDRARREDALVREHGAIEVGRERGNLTREAGWEVQPCVDSTTYWATSAIS
jgi:hypothetical protein